MQSKTCCRCRQSLPVASFCKDKNRKSGLGASCRVCNAAYLRAYKSSPKVKERIRIKEHSPHRLAHKKTYQRAYYIENKERIIAVNTAYVKANKEKVSARKSAWAKANAELLKERLRLRHLANRESDLERSRQHYLNNKERYYAQGREWRTANLYRNRKTQCVNAKRYRDELADSYIKRLINIPTSQIQNELIEAKRAHLKIVRIIKETRNGKGKNENAQ